MKSVCIPVNEVNYSLSAGPEGSCYCLCSHDQAGACCWFWLVCYSRHSLTCWQMRVFKRKI